MARTACFLVLLLGCAPEPAPRSIPVPASATPAAPDATPAAPDAAPAAPEPADAAPAPAPPDAAPAPAAAAPLPPGCLRQRQAFIYRCSGMPPGPGEPNATPTTVCDRCLVDADCREKKRGGKCVQVGGHPCVGPAHLECRYPSAACGGKICPEPVPSMPPSAPRR